MILCDDISSLEEQIKKDRHRLIAIDGRPASGKTTLACDLAERLKAQILHMDYFFLPKKHWASDIGPGYPFPFFRISEFADCVQNLAKGRPCTFFGYDFESDEVSSEPETISPDFPILVEGCSVLSKDLLSCYSLKILVYGDTETEFDAIAMREKHQNLETWKNLYIPSVNKYFLTKPWMNADVIFKGRGIGDDWLELFKK